MAAHEEGLLSDQTSPYKPTIVPMQDTKANGGGGGAAAAVGGGGAAAGGKARQYAAAIIVNLAALAAGSIMGWPSPGLAVLSSEDSPLDTDGDGIGDKVSEDHLSWLASINYLSGVPGTLLFGILADRLGRRVSALLVAVPYVASWVLVATTDTLLPLYAARLLAGVASGGTMVVCPLYVAETAQDQHRGALGTFLAVGINFGILFSFAVGAVTSYRVLPLVCLVLPAIYLLGMLRLPETPVYHVKRGRSSAARKALSWYRGGGAGPELDAELEALHAAAKREDKAADTAAVRDLFTHRGSRRALAQSMCLFVNLQFCGIMAVLSYTELIFMAAGSSLSPAASSVVVALIIAVATYLSSFLMDRAGRKTLLLWSNLVMAGCLIALGGFFFAKDVLMSDVSWLGWLPLAALSVYVLAFALGMGPVPLVLLGETYATKVRSLATSLGISCHTICGFLCTKLFPTLRDWLGLHGSLWLFACCCLTGALYTRFVVIETRGKSLGQILREFHGQPCDQDEEEDDVFRKEETCA